MENKIKDFLDLYAWQEGHKLVIQIYKITRKFPRDELFGLTSQMRRCAVSITSNIAEGLAEGAKTSANFILLLRVILLNYKIS